MKRITLFFALLAVLGSSGNAQAQSGSVAFDFPGGAAVEAGLTSPKPVPPDADGNRRTKIAVPVGSQGTVYAATRADGSTVVYLVPDGERPPAVAGLRTCGRYRDGDSLTLNTRTLILASGIAAAATAAMIHRALGTLDLSVHVGVGTGSLLGVVKRYCAEAGGSPGATCSGDDRGAVWDVGVNAQWYLSRRLDVGFRVGYIKPSGVTLDATSKQGNQTYSYTGSERGHLWGLGAEVGYHPTAQIRINSGLRFAPWNYMSKQAFGTGNQTNQTYEQENFGTARGFVVGTRYNFGLYGISLEASRMWLKDTHIVGEGPFDERFSMWLVAFHYSLASVRLWR